jgi:hypothetical protein
MQNKDKWAHAYDEGGMCWGIMTTNYAESVNNVFKGIRSRPVSGIIQYSFEKCNTYFVDRWQKARDLLDNRGKIGSFADEKMYEAALRSLNQFPEPYGPDRMIYSIRGSATTNVGGESHGGRHYRVDLLAGSCSCNGSPHRSSVEDSVEEEPIVETHHMASTHMTCIREEMYPRIKLVRPVYPLQEITRRCQGWCSLIQQQ